MKYVVIDLAGGDDGCTPEDVASFERIADARQWIETTTVRGDYHIEERCDRTKEHSPGPWINCGNHVDDANGLTILRSHRRFEEFNALDVRLAATAPEILEALTRIIERSESGNPDDHYSETFDGDFQFARDVVAKAKGGAA